MGKALKVLCHSIFVRTATFRVKCLAAHTQVFSGSAEATDRAFLSPQGNNNIIITFQRWPSVPCNRRELL